MTFYARMTSMADRLMEAYGREVTFVRTPKTVDETTGVVTSGTVVTCTAHAAILPYTADSDNATEAESLAGRHLRLLKVAALNMTFEPASLDVVTFGGESWQVMHCTPINPAGTALVYNVAVVKL